MWKDLSLKDKSALMQIMVNNGIYDLSTIRDTYNKFAEGGYVREKNNNPIAFDEEGNLTDQITGEKGTMMLPEVTVRGVSPETRAKNYSSYFDGTYELSQRDIYGMMPIIGDALDVKDIATDIYKGNYLNAGIGTGMFLLPNIIEKPLRKLSRVFKKPTKDIIENITDSNKFSITDQQWDAAYNKALQNNDLQQAQKLRDLHFTTKAPNTVAINDDGTPLKLYHGTDNNFNQFTFDLYGKTDNGGATFGKGIYTTPIKDYAQLYGKNIKELYSNLTNPRDYGYVNPMEFIQQKMLFGEEFATGNGIDGVIGNPSWKGIRGLKEYINHKPSALKYSDAITYDDNGKIIPLSKRDNFNNPDMRYSLLPIGLTIGGAAYLNQKNKNK